MRYNLQPIAVALLLNFSTAVPVFALSETHALSGDTYEKVERAYVISAGKSISARCNEGDDLTSGKCTAVNRLQSENEREHSVFLTSERSEENNLSWSCTPKTVHPEQVLLITSVAICKTGRSQAKR